MKLIFAQGNPGIKYENSRHNVGFMALDAFASSLEAVWSEKPKLHAYTCEVNIDDQKVLLVKPTTYYNETGVSARKIADFFKVSISDDLLVIHDDIDLPFGTVRIRKQGSDAGNNGIKSLILHLGGDFHRIRIGTDNELRHQIGELDFVLAKFSVEEQTKLQSDIFPQIIADIKQFCQTGINSTSHKI